MRRIIPIIAVVALAVAGFFIARQQGWFAPSEPEIEIVRQATVSRDRITATVNATGTIQPEALVSLSFGTSGTVRTVAVVRGQAVQAGDVLAELNAEELRLAAKQAEDGLRIQQLTLQQRLNSAPSAATLATAQADIDAAEANVAVAQANLASAEAGVTQAFAAKNQLLTGATAAEIAAAEAELAVRQAEYDLILEDYESLLQAEIGGRAEISLRLQRNQAAAGVQSAQARLDQLRSPARAADVQSADASIASAQAAVQAAEGNVAAANANLARARAAYDRLLEGPTADEIAILEANIASAQTSLELAQLRLEQAQIIAPMDGVVATLLVEPGELGSPGAPVITLLNESAFHLDVNVDEIDIDQIAIGQSVDITLDALSDTTLTGAIADIAPTAASAAGGVVTYLVTINIVDDAGVPLRAGLTANASIVVNEIESVLVVPNWAIRLDRESGQAFVNRLNPDGTFSEVTVSTGLRNEQFSEVTAGLDEGTVVVITNEREGFSLFGN